MIPQPHIHLSSTPLMIGYATLLALIVGFGGWAVSTEISGAVIASGRVEVQGHRQVVEHPEGGVVLEIAARDGASVSKGDVLFRLDGREARTQRAIIENELLEVIMRQNRLEAERKDATSIVFSAELKIISGAHQEINDLMQEQREMFRARRQLLASELAQFNERIIHYSEQIDHAAAEEEALRTQLTLVEAELASKERLRAKDLIAEPPILLLKRERSRLEGSIASLKRSMADLKGRIAEVKIEIVKRRSTFHEEVIAELRDLGGREKELKEQRRLILDKLDRLVIRAPVSGIVYGSTVHAVQSVVRAADPILYIVPQDIGLVIVGRLAVTDIEETHLNQDVSLRFSALDARNTPEIRGSVARISADAIFDEKTGQSHYEVEIRADDESLTRLDGVTIIPGMPVDAFIRTEDRTPLAYLTKPLVEYFHKAFLES